MTGLSISRKLWEHPNPESTQLWKFKTSLEKKVGRTFEDYTALYDYSCSYRVEFWSHAFHHFSLVYSTSQSYDPRKPCVDESAPMFPPPKWFDGINLNFAENVLFRGQPDGSPYTGDGKEDDKIACTGVREGTFLEPMQTLTWKELRLRVGRMSQAMRANGIAKGDRVAVVASNSIDTLTVFLGVTTLGGLFSSSSTDMGVKGILDRLLQIRPKYVFMDDRAVYDGKKIDLRAKMAEIANGMSLVPEFRGVVSQVRFQSNPADTSSIPKAISWSSFLSGTSSSDLVFERVSFSDPFLIVYSSGTTGAPKCIVHSTGGVIVSGHKEARLHRCIDSTSVQLQYTTTGWIMCLCRPLRRLAFVPALPEFLKIIEKQKVTHLGISPRYLQTLKTAKLVPKNIANLDTLKVVTSTGMVLSDALFEWFYDVAFSSTVQLDNMSGGTDLASAIGTGNPILPIYVGGCQSFSLGIPAEVFDQAIQSGNRGTKVDDGVQGELVITKSFPTMPVMFWGGGGDQLYFESYFTRFPGVWTHGDCIKIHPVAKNILFNGRADGVLNPSGVRFGSAEIYSVIDTYFSAYISDSICVGQRRPNDTDENVMLFLLLHPGVKFTERLVNEVKAVIRNETSPRHVPKYVFETPDIPTTMNLKKVELPVKHIVSGMIIEPSATLLNPQSLNYYYQFAKVEELIGQQPANAKL